MLSKERTWRRLWKISINVKYNILLYRTIHKCTKVCVFNVRIENLNRIYKNIDAHICCHLSSLTSHANVREILTSTQLPVFLWQIEMSNVKSIKSILLPKACPFPSQNRDAESETPELDVDPTSHVIVVTELQKLLLNYNV